MQNCYDQDIYDVLNLDDPMISEDCHQNMQDQEQEDIQSFFHFKHQVKEKIQLLPSTSQSQAMDIQPEVEEHDQDTPNLDSVTEPSSFHLKPSSHNEIIQFSEALLAKRAKIMNGYPNETHNLGKHFKSVTSSFLRILIEARCLDPDEEEVMRQFNNTNGSIDDFNKLYEWAQIKQKCQDYYQSKNILQTILKSGKMDFRSKIALLRHLELFRKMTSNKTERWKIQIR